MDSKVTEGAAARVSGTALVTPDADLRIKLIPHAGGRKVRVLWEYDPEMVAAFEFVPRKREGA